MRRRQFIRRLGGAIAAPSVSLPRVVQAQSGLPVIGFINSASAKGYARPLSAFLGGLGESGYADGRNVNIEYRWGEGQYDRLPALLADLVARKVNVIAATSTPAALAARAAITTIPVVFTTSSDPVKIGLVTSLGRPGGNVTGVTQLNVEVLPKRLEIARELLPTATVVGLLINQHSSVARTLQQEAEAAAAKLGLQLKILHASTDAELDDAFKTLRQARGELLVIAADAFFTSKAEHLAALAIQNSIPAVYNYYEFAAAGGLVSYGGDIMDSYRLAGGYVGRILNDEKPADLPVQQVTKVELIVNLKTAKALGITVPVALLGRADEVIE